MTKRNASSNLNQDNWDEEDEPEEQGQFIPAAKEELQKRVIKVAKRKNPNATSGASAFAGFAGFGSFTSTNNSMDVVASKNTNVSKSGMEFKTGNSFLTNNTTPFTSNATKCIATPFPANGLFPTSLTAGSDGQLSANLAPSNAKNEEGLRPPAYFHNLTALNKSVRNWINLHVDKTPHCDLTPVFKDYVKYLEELSDKYPAKKDKLSEQGIETTSSSKTSNNSMPVVASLVGAEVVSSSSPNKEKEPNSDSTSLPANNNPFANKSSLQTNVESSKPGTLFGSSTGSLFPMTNSVFSFAAASNATNNNNNTEPEDEQYEPPEPEIVPVTEEDAVYSIKCKLFYKHDDKYNERGVGMLHLKKQDSGKTQLVVRADTNLGNILLNILLNQDVKTQLNGKHVLIVCVPNPPIKNVPTGPVPMLIRVKSEDEAQKLLQIVDKHKADD